jgi:uncharacterized iron-regulated membrane protein
MTIKTWSRIHTWTSLVSMLFLLMLCVTGLPLIFHHEIDELFEEEISAPTMSANTPRASLDRVVEAVQKLYPSQFILFLQPSQTEPVVSVATSPTAVPLPGMFLRTTFDARTVEILGEEVPRFDVMNIVLRIHKDMFVGLPGELFLGGMGLVFVVSIVSGIVVYWPFMRRLDFGSIRSTFSRVKWLDRHNLLGIVTVAWALVVGLTGTINTLATPLSDLWRAQYLPTLLAPYVGKPVAQIPSIQAVVDNVREKFPDRIVTQIIMPTSGRFGSPQHLIVGTKGSTPFTSRMREPILVDANDASSMIAPQVPWYLKVLQVSRPLHFGDYGELPLKIIWALFDIITIIILLSGLYLWAIKKRPFVDGGSSSMPRMVDPKREY